MFRLFSLALLFFPAALLAQQDNFALRSYTAIHGLPQSQVSSIVEDDNGYLWMGTQGGGLARFDGQDFKVYTTLDGLLSNIVNHVALDSKQNLWIVHPRGITKFDGVTFKKFQAPGELSKLKMVRRAFVFQDTVFIMSAPGLLGKIYNDSVYYWGNELEKGRFISRVHQLSGGELFFLLNNGQIILKTLQGNQPVEPLPMDRRIYSGYNYDGEMRVLTFSPEDESTYAYSLNLSDRKFEPIKNTLTEPVAYFNNATRTYWLKRKDGLYSIKENETSAQLVLADTEVNQVIGDSEGNFWIATNGRGLLKYFHQDFSRCSSENMRGVMSIYKDKNGVTWIGTMNKGLWKIKKGEIRNYFDKTESYRNNINCIAQTNDGTIWIGTAGGLGRYDHLKDEFHWYTVKDGLTGYSVISIVVDEKENLWIGTPAGLNYFDGDRFSHYKTEQGLITNTVSSLYYSQKSKTLYVGNEFGINAFTNGKVSRLSIKGFENSSILSIQSYRDSLIAFGSGGAGFAIYNPATATSRLITTHDGLVSDFIYFVTADEENRIWVGTEKGVSRLVLNDKLEIVENIHFDHDNGLDGVETNQNSFYISRKKKFFGLIDGLYQFNDFQQSNVKSFGTHLTGVDVFYGEDSSRQYANDVIGFFKLPDNPVFPSDKNHITFSFNLVDKRYPKSVRFKYMLNSYDKTWSKPSPNRQVTYSNLPPGEYEFLVMATDGRGSWSNAPLRYPFTVKAPFYQTATFGVITFLVLLGIIILVAYLRVRQRVEKAMTLERIRVQEQESLRKEIARDFHDEMGNQLTRIINYVSLLKLNGNGHSNGNGKVNGHTDSRLDELYTKVENSAKYLYSGTRDFIWAIDPVNDELSKLFIHIRDFGEKLFEEKRIQFRANNSVKEKIRLPYGFSREVNLIFKEVMTNTFKYSEANNATLSLQRVGTGFEIRFEDDGIGFNTSEVGKLNGLKNIRERADKIQSVLRIRSKEGEGTRISLDFQFTKTPNYGITL